MRKEECARAEEENARDGKVVYILEVYLYAANKCPKGFLTNLIPKKNCNAPYVLALALALGGHRDRLINLLPIP